MTKKLILLGSTGSIGTQMLEIVRKYPREFKIIGLSCYSNEKLFKRQVAEFKPKYACVAAREKNPRKALMKLAALREADLIVNAISGPAGFWPTYAAIKAGKKIALANKESLVIGGDVLMPLARKTGAQILPIDSEASAVWQLLCHCEPLPKAEAKQSTSDSRLLRFARNDIKKVIITASGGPFWGWPREKLKKVTPAQALKHPTWKMGKKLTIDSATMVNKGFEIIEVHRLFGIPAEKIDVAIHRKSLVHALVEYKDGTVAAHISTKPDMKEFISRTLFFGKVSPVAQGKIIRFKGPLSAVFKQLELEKPDFSVLKGVNLARKVLKKGGSAPAVLCKANEIAVQKFLAGEFPFLEIYEFIEKVLKNAKNGKLDIMKFL